MIEDLVLDTNVLAHANNNQESRQQFSISLIKYLLSSTELVCVDPGFSFSSRHNSSFIASEYFKHLNTGTLGYAFLVEIAKNRRIKETSISVDRATAKKIIQRIGNKRDRTFIKTTINSINRILISHDLRDFSVENRRYFRAEMRTDIIQASEFLESVNYA
jgi:predicted nucleic acid-binding protein